VPLDEIPDPGPGNVQDLRHRRRAERLARGDLHDRAGPPERRQPLRRPGGIGVAGEEEPAVADGQGVGTIINDD
jgi:hypothetical protein